MGWLCLSWPTGTPCKPVDYRYSRSTVCTVSPLYEVCASNIICDIISVTTTMSRNVLVFLNAHRSSDYNTTFVISQCLRFLLVAELLNALWCNSAHNKQNTFWLWLWFRHLHWLVCRVLLLVTGSGLKCWVEDRHKHEPTVQKRSWNLYSRTKDICLWSHIALTREIKVCEHFSSSTDCIWTYSPQHPDKPTLPVNLNIIIGLKPKQCLSKYDDMLQLQIYIYIYFLCFQSWSVIT